MEKSPPLGQLSIDRLTSPAVETNHGDLLHDPITDKRRLLARACAVREALDEELRQFTWLEGEYFEAKEVRWSRFKDALVATERGDWSRLKSEGIMLDPSWLSNFVQAMLRNRPVEVQVVATPSLEIAKNWQNNTSHIDFESILNKHNSGISMAALLRRLSQLEYTRPVLEVDDLFYADTHLALSALHRQALFQHIHTHLEEQGVVNTTDIPGEDYLFISRGRRAEQVDELIDYLDYAETGMVVRNKDGGFYFRPNEHIHESNLRSHPPTKMLPKEGILLKEANGTPSAVAISASSYIDHINSNFAHVRFQSASFQGLLSHQVPLPSDHVALDILGQSLDRVHPHNRYNIYYDQRYLIPRRATYAFATLLRNEINKVIENLKEYDDVKVAMNPEHYLQHNYANPEGMWPEDVQGVSVIAAELPLHFRPESLGSATVIGYGPFSYPALAIAPFMKPDGAIAISDLLPANITFAEQWFDGTASNEHGDVYHRFARAFQDRPQSGIFYADCENQLQQTGKLQVASLEELPSDSAQLVVESFVSCSFNSEKYGFFEAIRQKARILKWEPGSMMIAVHMVGSPGWNNSGDDEGVKMEAANLTLEDIKNGYISAGLRIIKAVPLYADTSFREEHKGMVVIFAAPDTLSKPASIPR
jgi:hypothetical protein